MRITFKYLRIALVLVLLVVSVVATVIPVSASPVCQMPYGMVTVNGQRAVDGTSVVAKNYLTGATIISTTTQPNFTYNTHVCNYVMAIPGDSGTKVSIYVDGVLATELYLGMGLLWLDLSVQK